MSTPPLPAAEYYASLPRVIAGAGAVFHDSADRILLVQPTYRDDTWEIPGGGMEEGEFPLETARREIGEELGLDVQPGGLLVVDWVPPQPDGRPALVNFVFDAGLITPRQVRALRLQDSELRAWRLCSPRTSTPFWHRTWPAVSTSPPGRAAPATPPTSTTAGLPARLLRSGRAAGAVPGRHRGRRKVAGGTHVQVTGQRQATSSNACAILVERG